MKRSNLVLAILAVMLVLGMSVGKAWSYFTDSDSAEGTLTLSVQPSSEIEEHNDPGMKTIRIRNTSQAVSVWVRARVYANPKLGASASGDNWQGDIVSWYEYGVPLSAGAEAEPLYVKFHLPRPYDEQQGEGALDGDETNVIVVYEYLPTQYDTEGKPLAPIWYDENNESEQ
jgi:predicted ribosomally synthesized peptide with SipW-like signal peptide